MHDPKRPPPPAPLEVELPELPATAGGPAFDDKAAQARSRDERGKELAVAIEENLKAQPDFKAFAWKSFLGLGIASLIYFLSWVRSDPVSFREGAGLLWHGLVNLTATAIMWGAGLALFRKLPLEAQRKMGKAAGITCLALILLVVLNTIGLFDRPGYSVWMSGRFLFTLALQGLAWWGLFRVRRRFAAQVDSGEGLTLFTRPLMYLSESLLIVVSLGVMFQIIFHINSPSIYLAIFRSGKLAAVCALPLGGYVLIRKLTEL